MYKNRRSFSRGVFALAVAVVVSSCSGDFIAPVSEVPEHPDSNAFLLTGGVQLCKYAPDATAPSWADFVVSAAPNVGSFPLGTEFRLDASTQFPGNCEIVWTPVGLADGWITEVTIAEVGMTPGMALRMISVIQPDKDRVDYQETSTVVVGVRQGVGATVIFKNGGTPDDAPLTVTKTAAGSFDRTYTWDLTKSVSPTSHTGNAGQIAGSSTWSVNAIQAVVNGNFAVTGEIVVSNSNGFAVDFDVTDELNDGTVGVVDCPTFTVPASGSVTCTYLASPGDASATLNTATVTSDVGGDTATAAVSFTANVIGDSSVTLGDERFSYSTVISGTTPVTFPETFRCPPDASRYTNGVYQYSETNIATLVGDNTNLSADATVNVTCRMPAEGETATGAGFPWSETQGAPSNWFMYTPWSTTSGHRGISVGTTLIAGRHHVAGTITGTRTTGGSGRSTITITLNSSFTFDGAVGNVKIHPMSCTTKQPYVSPGQFAVHRTAAVSDNSITVADLPNTACYGIHVDVLHAQ
jgi:hypothetical protein